MCLEAGGAGQLIMSETGELVNDNRACPNI